MSTPILATKLYVPLSRPTSVLRARLLKRLNEGLHRKLTLLSAPAGFGKTTLVSEWIAAPNVLEGRRIAWLSLDEADSDPTRFLAYLIAALQSVAPTFGESVWAALHSPQPPPTETMLTTLLNEIATLPDHLVLVLDDYHLLDAIAIDQALAFLIEHLPPQMHLVITTREDPPLPLARYRVRGQLTEVRAADLRFTAVEAADFLNEAMGLDLSAADVATLEERTEGWIAGLQLAALSMQGHADVPGFIRAFAGDQRYIVDYLVEEVLHQQPATVRNFLLQTAILEQLSGPLCYAVTGQKEGHARLEALERGNFFVMPLDDKRHWYRYHRLFADVLHARLLEEQPDQVPTLHRRASEWYADNGLPADAIRHALAAKDFARAAGLVELAMPAIRRSRQEATALGWLRSLPDEVVRVRPVLSVAYAGTLMSSGKFEGVEARLCDAERWLDTGDKPKGNAVVVDEAGLRLLPGMIAIYRAGYSLAQGNLPDTVNYATRGLDLIPEEEHLWRGAAAALLGLASWASGNLEAAHRSYAEGMARMQRAGHISDIIGCAIVLAAIRIEQGRLREAMHTYEQALQLANEQGTTLPRGMANLYTGMGELALERNDLHAATLYLLRSKELGELAALPRNPFCWCVAMAHIREIEGDLAGALDLLHEAERLYVSDFHPNVHPVAARKARVWVAQGWLDEAFTWAREQGISAHDDLSYLREFEHITLARSLLAHAKSDRADHAIREAMGHLARLLKAAEEGERTGSVIEILILQALAHQLQGDKAAALVPLQQAMTLAKPEGYVRIFVNEGPPMTQLLLEAAARGIMPGYIDKLLAASGVEQPRQTGQTPLPTFPASQLLIEPLSQRELDVLRLFKSELSGPEIAGQLVVALSTVRTHTKSIFSKLNVNSRQAAVKRAAELGLI